MGGSPKRGRNRSLRLTRRAVNALSLHRKAQLEERMEKAGLWEHHGPVCALEVGTIMSGRNLYRAFKVRHQRAGPPETFAFTTSGKPAQRSN